MYHRVTDEAEQNWGPWQYAVTPATFESHVARVASRYNVVSIDDILAFVNGDRGTLPDSAAVLTFDDGYADTVTEALPVLERHAVPATVYVSTALLGSTEGPFVFQLAKALNETDPTVAAVPDIGSDLPETLPEDPRQAYEILRRPAKWAPVDTRNHIVETVAKDGSVPATPMLTEREVQSLATHDLVTVGAHAHEHVPLTSLSSVAMRENIKKSASCLADILGRRPVHFSYPYGSSNEQVRIAVSEAGFETSVTTTPRIVHASKLPDQRYSIPRLDAAVYGV